jgi:four helix bundle suffix protein
LRLIDVARASLQELLEDYKDFLRLRKLPLWDKDHPQAQAIRRIAYQSDKSYSSYQSYIEQSPPEVAANTLICVIHQANYLLDRQLESLERAFLNEGGFTERLYHARRQHRSHPSDSSYPSHRPPPPQAED